MGLLTKKPIEKINSSLLDEYSNKVFKLVVLIVPIFFLGGNTTMTILHYTGQYPAVEDVAMWISNAIDIFYLCVSIYLIRTSYGSDGLLIPNKLKIAKLVLMLMVLMQWNLNSYICPFEDFWAYAPLFVIVQAFFFDLKLVRVSTFLILFFMAISWIFNGEHLLPAKDEFFMLNFIFRVICLMFTLLSINIIAWFGKVFIIEMVASREKEREMREKSDEYEREARVKSDFLANMSHEIRTPMNAVIGMAEIAMREDLPPGAVDCLNQIQKSGRNLLNIINDILDYSKIDSGKMEIVPERYEPSSELYDISNMLATRIENKKLELYVAADTNIPHALLGDSMRIRQILINLANNAIKFTKTGSVEVVVTCEHTDEETVAMTFHIRDTGIGIREEDMEKLFVSFQQVDSRRNRSVEGTGLGLAICQRLVEAMDGQIGVSSEYGKGSDFWFTIPQKVLDSTVDMTVEEVNLKRAFIMDNDPERIRVFFDDFKNIGIERKIINNTKEYESAPGLRDYLFFDIKRLNDTVTEFLRTHPAVTGIVIVDFNSDFNTYLENLFILRRPISTQRIVQLLNDKNEDNQVYDTEAYSINFSAPTAKILIVDDNAINITIAEGLLAPMNIGIDSALSGPEAIEKINKEDYDIVFMDHMMPGMDGVDATRIIRETKSEDELVIIALSANAIVEARNTFFDAGMNDFVAKPIEIKELVAKIHKWLPDEKIEKGKGANASQDENSTNPLAGFDMLDTSRAVASLGSPHLLRKIAQEYYKTGRENYDDIVKAFNDENWKDYTIKIHALKSSSRQIGAYEIGDIAETLERAGKDNDSDYIKKYTRDMLYMYNELLDSLEPLFPESEDLSGDLPALSDESLSELIDKLSAACDDLDTEAMEGIREELKAYAWPDDLRDNLEELCEAIDGMEVITCEDIIETLREENGGAS